MPRHIVSNDEQHQIVLAIQDHVTQTFTLTHRFYASKPNPIITPTVDFVDLINKLDDCHREKLESFLDEKLNKRHYFSPRTVSSAMPESILFGLIMGGITASLPVVAALSVGTYLTTHIIEQVGHQSMVKSRAQAVANALKTVKEQEALEVQEAEKVKQESSLLGNTIFTEKAKEPPAPLNQEDHYVAQQANIPANC